MTEEDFKAEYVKNPLIVERTVKKARVSFEAMTDLLKPNPASALESSLSKDARVIGMLPATPESIVGRYFEFIISSEGYESVPFGETIPKIDIVFTKGVSNGERAHQGDPCVCCNYLHDENCICNTRQGRQGWVYD